MYTGPWSAFSTSRVAVGVPRVPLVRGWYTRIPEFELAAMDGGTPPPGIRRGRTPQTQVRAEPKQFVAGNVGALVDERRTAIFRVQQGQRPLRHTRADLPQLGGGFANRVFGTGDPLMQQRQGPTALIFRNPHQGSEALSHRDRLRAGNGRRLMLDRAIAQCLRFWPRPGGVIAHEDRPLAGRQMGEVQVQQGQAIRLAVLQGFIQARPAPAEHWTEGQFRKGVHRRSQQDGVGQFEQGIAGWPQSLIGQLTKCFQSVNVLGGRIRCWHTPILPQGGWRSRQPPSFSLNSNR